MKWASAIARSLGCHLGRLSINSRKYQGRAVRDASRLELIVLMLPGVSLFSIVRLLREAVIQISSKLGISHIVALL